MITPYWWILPIFMIISLVVGIVLFVYGGYKTLTRIIDLLEKKEVK